MTQSKTFTRRGALRTLAGLPLAASMIGLPRFASAATPEYEFKFGHNLPTSHPLHIRALEAAARVAEESKGRMAVSVFPNNQLGGDTDMLAQVRSGGIDMFNAGTMVIATLTPISAITAVGFAFSDASEVWKTVDGKLGDTVRGAFAKVGLHTLEKMWDNGFRQITTGTKPVQTAADMDGMKIRVPVSPMGISLFKALGSAPTSLQFSEVYSALQTKVVDAQENPLVIVETAKLYEVQKYCSLTNHSWDGYHMVVNGRSWRNLPDDLKAIYSRAFNEAGLQQRDDLAKLNTTLQEKLAGTGLKFNTADTQSFRDQLRKAGFYAEWKKKFGDEAWALLEASVGKVS
jgi:tripartite ATP-independent transporter DctP family solute receptor